MNELTYEAMIQRMKEIIEYLENDQSSLESSLTVYKEGMELIKACENRLEGIASEITEIQNNQQPEAL